MACGQAINITALDNATVYGFMSPPNVRGTSQILYSCLLTIIACIYTSVHLNIPPPGEATKWQLLRRIKWTLVGVLAPEIVLYSAWTQYQQANALITKMSEVAPELVYMDPTWYHMLWKSFTSHRRRQKQSEDVSAEIQMVQCTPGADGAATTTNSHVNVEPNARGTTTQPTKLSAEAGVDVLSSEGTARERRLLDLKYGFYVIMGGIRVDTSSLHDKIKTMVPSFKMLMFMLDQHDEVHDGQYLVSRLLVEASTIRDRSKADNIAKALICCQVLGMAVQCIARKIYSLPLTLLEVHTFAHVVCAILLYTTWFKKPLNINEATNVSLPDLYLAKFATQVVSFQPRSWWFEITTSCACSAAKQVYWLDENILFALHVRTTAHNPWYYGEARECEFVDASLQRPQKKNWPYKLKISDNNGSIIMNVDHDVECTADRIISVQLPLDESERRRWSLWDRQTRKPYASIRQSNYFETYHLYFHRRPLHKDFFNALIYVSGFGQLVDAMFFNWSILAGAFLILSLYGAVHLTAWNSYFPTLLETWLWRASGLVIITSAPNFILLVLLDTLPSIIGDPSVFPRLGRYGFDKDTYHLVFGPLDKDIYLLVSRLLMFLLLPAIILVTISARLLLVIEPFVALRASPAGVYRTVPWSQFIPHL